MFFAQFCVLVLMKNLLPKWSLLAKGSLKMRQNYEIDKSQGGFAVMRYHDQIFGSNGLQGMLSTPPKPFDHILHTRGKIGF